MDANSKATKIYVMENITTEEVMDNLYMFQARLGKLDEFGCWDMEIIQTDNGLQFNSKDFQEGLSVRVLQLILSALDHQEMNGQVEVTWQKLRTTAHSIMVPARVLNEYTLVELM